MTRADGGTGVTTTSTTSHLVTLHITHRRTTTRIRRARRVRGTNRRRDHGWGPNALLLASRTGASASSSGTAGLLAGGDRRGGAGRRAARDAASDLGRGAGGPQEAPGRVVGLRGQNLRGDERDVGQRVRPRGRVVLVVAVCAVVQQSQLTKTAHRRSQPW